MILLFIPPWILLQTNHRQPVEVQLLGGIEKVEEEVEIREEAEGEMEKDRKGEKRSRLVTFIFIFHFINSCIHHSFDYVSNTSQY